MEVAAAAVVGLETREVFSHGVEQMFAAGQHKPPGRGQRSWPKSRRAKEQFGGSAFGSAAAIHCSLETCVSSQY